MHKQTSFWTVSKLRDRIRQISFPEYQREPSIWQRGAKQKLIDSIVRQFDIASIYFYDNGDGTWDCVDGRQRIAAIMSFLDSNDADTEDAGFPYKVTNEIYDDEQDHTFTPLKDRTYSEISALASSGDPTAQSFVKALEGYEFTVVELSAAARAEEFNLQFTRLNLGAIINSGEKLHAMVGELRDICFHKLAANPFLASIDIPTRRYAREQLAAQIAAQIITIENAKNAGRAREFARVRHMDLQKLFKDNTEVGAETRNWLDRVEEVMNLLADHSESLPPLRSRAIVLSIVLLAYEHGHSDPAHAKLIADFAKLFVGRLRWLVSEVSGGHGADELYLYLLEFQKHLTQASAEKPAIQTRAKCLEDSFEYWLANGRVLPGDKEYSENHPGSQPSVL